METMGLFFVNNQNIILSRAFKIKCVATWWVDTIIQCGHLVSRYNNTMWPPGG